MPEKPEEKILMPSIFEVTAYNPYPAENRQNSMYKQFSKLNFPVRIFFIILHSLQLLDPSIDFFQLQRFYLKFH